MVKHRWRFRVSSRVASCCVLAGICFLLAVKTADAGPASRPSFGVELLSDGGFEDPIAGGHFPPWKFIAHKDGQWVEASLQPDDVAVAENPQGGHFLEFKQSNKMISRTVRTFEDDIYLGCSVVARASGLAKPGQGLVLRVGIPVQGQQEPQWLGQQVTHPADGQWHDLIVTARLPRYNRIEALVVQVFRCNAYEGSVFVDNASLKVMLDEPLIRQISLNTGQYVGGVMALLLLMGFAVLFFRRSWKRPSKLRDFSLNATVLVCTLMLLLVGLEGYFRYGYIHSDKFGMMLVAKHWFAKYWSPVNSKEWRDREHPPEAFAGEKALFVVGDSFTAGHGINDYRDRFSDIIQRRLGDGWEVVNMARNGWSTADEYEALTAYPQKPNVIVLAYVYNDIEGAARKHGIVPDFSALRPSKTTLAFINRSFFLDFVYWRCIGLARVVKPVEDYRDVCYSNDEIWAQHAEELKSFVRYARDNQAQLIVVTFPRLGDVETTKWITDKVGAVFSAEGVPVLDVAQWVSGQPTSRFVVSPYDRHPNEALHARTAEEILKCLGDSPSVLSEKQTR